MPQSLARIYIHLVFSTKNRRPLLTDESKADLLDYMGGILRDLSCPCLEINTEPDHAHVLFALSRTMTVADIVGQLKKGSTVWLQQQHPLFREFHWQNGYGAFSVSQSNVDSVRDYIRNQHDHHHRQTFQDEFRALLVRHGFDVDERYVWD
jgi:REP element-mobilizing transposase RayT